MNNKSNIATYLLPLSIFSLSAAFVYFTFVLSQVAGDIPILLEKIENTSNKIKPVVEEISKIRELIPPITHEVTELRKKIPAILDEVKKTREITPSILKEVKQTRESIPVILKDANKIIDKIPGIITKGENLVMEARQMGKKSSEGAVTGVVTGIIKAPFQIIGGVFSIGNLRIKGITEADQKIVNEIISEALAIDKVGQSFKWSNSQSGNEGSVTIKERKEIKQRDCRLLAFVTTLKNDKTEEKIITVCLSDKGKWEKFK